MAYRLAVRNGIANIFSKDCEHARKKWMKNFLKRNLRTHKQRVFIPEVVSQFFNFFELAVNKIHHSSCRLYNCGETGISHTA
jgi:hypothetical protein